MPNRATYLTAASLLVLLTIQTMAQQPAQPLTRILFIFDASNSMNGLWKKQSKIEVASKLLAQALDSLHNVPNLQLALRVYGNEKSYLKGQDCDDTRLHVPFGNNNFGKIKSELLALKPKGTTPIAATLEKSGGDFPPCPSAECRNIIILITDGIEECDGDPCAVSRALQSQGIVLKPFVIGVGLDLEFRETFECVGNYYDAADESRFGTVLGIVISQALNNTTAQINLLDQQGNPTETNIPMTLYDQRSGEVIHNYVHTMNAKGNPDTLNLDPAHTFRIVAQTIPTREKDSIVITPGKHTIIGINTPQGELEFKMAAMVSDLDKIKVIVREAGSLNTLHVQSFAEKQKYIVGSYDLEILTLPRTYVGGVVISQSHTTTIELPQPGLVSFMKPVLGHGAVYIVRNNQLEHVATLSDTKDRESLSLMPGEYVAVFRPKQARQTKFTVERDFKVTSGASVSVKLN